MANSRAMCFRKSAGNVTGFDAVFKGIEKDNGGGAASATATVVAGLLPAPCMVVVSWTRTLRHDNQWQMSPAFSCLHTRRHYSQLSSVECRVQTSRRRDNLYQVYMYKYAQRCVCFFWNCKTSAVQHVPFRPVALSVELRGCDAVIWKMLRCVL